MKPKYYYSAIATKDKNGYTLKIPDMKNCWSRNDSLDEAIKQIKEEIYIELINRKPEEYDETPPEKIKYNPQKEFLVTIEFDIRQMFAAHDTRTVNKTITIPMWLNILATKANISASSLYKKALYEELGLNIPLNFNIKNVTTTKQKK